jgi:hypothetical protein
MQTFSVMRLYALCVITLTISLVTLVRDLAIDGFILSAQVMGMRKVFNFLGV